MKEWIAKKIVDNIGLLIAVAIATKCSKEFYYYKLDFTAPLSQAES